MLNTKVSHYKILDQIGSGGMGDVYLAEDLNLRRKVAIKFLRRDLVSDAKAGERFLREARAAAALTHPNIVTIHEIDTFRRQTYIVMEFIPGITLEEKLIEIGETTGRRKKRLRADEIEERLEIFYQLCKGVREAHANGILHRDIKPKNVIIKKDGQVKILDFGLARLHGSERLTAESVTLGTLHYLSPEQLQGQKPERSMDIWALGVVFFRLLLGVLPFGGENTPSLIEEILKGKQPPLPAGVLPPELMSIINRALHKKKSRRYQEVGEMMVDLKKCQHRLHSGKISFKTRERHGSNRNRDRRWLIPMRKRRESE